MNQQCKQLVNPTGFSPCNELSSLLRDKYVKMEFLYPIGRPIIIIQHSGIAGAFGKTKEVRCDYCPFCGFKFKGKATAYPVAAAESDVELK